MGTLYYGDNLDILRRYLKDETVGLVYLDPPFNSAQSYNAFFHEKDGTEAASQIRAFEDTWHWDIHTKKAYAEITEQPGKVSDVMQAFYTFLGGNDMMAYLTMMAPRLVELRRVLKPAGSLYLHCDPTASHYLKLLCDAVFGTDQFRNEITWKRTFAHGNVGRNYGSIADVILFYTKGEPYCWNQPYRQLSPEEMEEKYPFVDGEGRRWQSVTLRNPGQRPNLHFPFQASNGVTYQPHPNGWSCNLERMQKYDREGRLHFPSKPGGALRLKMFADESQGEKLQNIWEDIAPIGANAAERLGYPTQKPVALLERIIKASSNPGDLVLDPFCGCGTTIDAAEKLGRRWIGIDITQLATSLIKNRLRDTYGDKVEILTIGEPTTPNEAFVLAEQDKFQFQWWALGLVGARPVEQKKGADHGIDGKILFRDDPRAPRPEQIIIQVKGGKTGVKDVRDLRGVIDRENAAIGVLISLQPATAPMETEAASAEFYEHKLTRAKYPRLQLRTVKELMEGKGIERPSSVAAVDETFKRAPKAEAKGHKQTALGIYPD
ncbi:MAG TPA: DNA methyltransferase [Candidatus Acidoferrum sp.]|nr:DNA methyltransferase [Candidatus Acidoferrum sp.]